MKYKYVTEERKEENNVSLRYGCKMYVATVKDKIHTREMDSDEKSIRTWLVGVRVCACVRICLCAILSVSLCVLIYI